MEEESDPVKVHDKLADDYLKKFSEPSTFLPEYVDILEDGKVLDAGCGPGVDANYLSDQGFDVVAVDLSEEMLRVGRENFPEIDFQKNDLRELDFEDNSFDGIVASFSLIYIPKSDVEKVIQDFHNFLKPNGLLFLGLQEGESKETEVDDPATDGKVFMNIMSEQEVEQLLGRNGFVIEKKYIREPESEKEFDFNKLFVIARLQPQ